VIKISELDILRKASHGLIDALKFLWMDRKGGMRDLDGHHVGHYLGTIGYTVAQIEPALPALPEHFALLALVSRKPYGTVAFTASSTTEFVIRQGIVIAHLVDNTVSGMRICKTDGVTEEQRETYRKAWPVLREPFDNSQILPTYGQCTELAAEVDWEFHRAVGLLPQTGQPGYRGTIEVFVSYSHKDERLREKLTNHLSQLKHEGLIGEWHDRKILPGTEWDGQINEHLSKAHIILLLVSPDFLASPYAHDVEVKRALQRHDSGDARVIPVILRPCDWHTSLFGKLQALPKNGKPVTKWNNRDEALTDVAKGLRAVIAEMIAAPSKQP